MLLLVRSAAQLFQILSISANIHSFSFLKYECNLPLLPLLQNLPLLLFFHSSSSNSLHSYKHFLFPFVGAFIWIFSGHFLSLQLKIPLIVAQKNLSISLQIRLNSMSGFPTPRNSKLPKTGQIYANVKEHK